MVTIAVRSSSICHQGHNSHHRAAALSGRSAVRRFLQFSPQRQQRFGSHRSRRPRLNPFRAQFLLLALAVLFTSTCACAATCNSFSGTSVSFGTYTGAAVSPGSSPFRINCPNGQTYQILLDKGQSPSGSELVREMTNGANTLKYGLYQDAAHTNNFGNSTATGYYPATGTGTTQTVPVYPLLTAGQTVAPGTYTDTITATLGANSSGSTTFTVTATVVANCTISATALAFGTYTSNASKTATSTIFVTCTNMTTYTVGLNQGASVGATVNTRAMTGPSAALLYYHIYQQSSHSTGWNNTDVTVAGTGTGSAQTLTAYGIILSGQLVRPGSYTDTIVANITY